MNQNKVESWPRPSADPLQPESGIAAAVSVTAFQDKLREKSINILIVDDEHKNLTVLETLLDDPSYRLVRAESADQALLSLVEEEFALLILDIRMPGMSGFELAQMIKERKKTARVPIIFLSAYYNEDQHVLEGYSSGAVDYLHKPVNPIILRSKVAVFAELHRKNLDSVEASRALLAEVTQRRRAEEELRELNENLEQRVTERTEALSDSEERYRLMAEALARAKEAADAANLAKDQFLAVLSHELRTPLTPVRMTVSIWERQKELFPPDFVKDLAMIRRNVDLECRLIDDMLDLNRIACGKLELQVGHVDLNEEARHAVAIVESDAAAKQVAVSFEAAAVQSNVFGDAARLQQILWNLVRNAIKFTPPHGSVVVRTYNSNDSQVCVEVRDTGVGIEPDFIRRIFNAFEQGGAEVTRQFGGLGLGLSISKALCDLHNGSLTAQSEGKGRGATFTMRLDVAAPSDTTGLPSAIPLVKVGLPADYRGRLMHILLVEDHQDTARIMKRLLSALGYQVHTASSVAQALSAVEAQVFDLMISDIGLPDGTGYDLLRQVQPRYPISAIALTGFGMDDDVKRAEEAGFLAHLTKPVSVEQLEATMKLALASALSAPSKVTRRNADLH